MRQFITLSVLSLTIAFVLAAPARADGPLPWKGSGSGDWNGQRTHLDEDFGLTFWFLEDVVAQQNVRGGVSKGGAVTSRAVLEVNFQFEPLTPLKGSEIQVSAAWTVGTNVQDSVGSLLSSTGNWRPASMRLFELYWGQSFADEQVNFKIGRINFCNAAAFWGAYLDGAISNGYYCNPGGIYLNQPVPANSVWPIATWGARIKIEPKKQDFVFFLGVYNGSQADTQMNASEHGVDFRLNLFESTFVLGEFLYKLNQDPEDHGLPGNYRIGGMYDSGSFARLDDSTQTRRGNPGYYLIGDQMLFRERNSNSKDQGLYGMANFVHNPRTAFNLAPYWVSAALYYKGAIPHRDADTINFGFYYASLSPDSALDYELQFRVYYTFQFTPWFFMSPHAQIFKKPGGGQLPNAVVLGMFFHITL
jgi:porin